MLGFGDESFMASDVCVLGFSVGGFRFWKASELRVWVWEDSLENASRLTGST